MLFKIIDICVSMALIFLLSLDIVSRFDARIEKKLEDKLEKLDGQKF